MENFHLILQVCTNKLNKSGDLIFGPHYGTNNIDFLHFAQV